MASTTAQLKPAGTAAEPDPGSKKPKKSKKKLMIIIAVVLVVVGGGYYKFGMKKKAGPPPPPKPGLVLVLDAITINLTDGHYLKLKLSLQEIAKVKGVPDGSQALDLAIEEFGNRSVAELTSTAQRARYKADLLTKVKKAYKGDIMDLYFTEFVMQ